MLLESDGRRISHDSCIERHADHPRRGGYRHSGVRPAENLADHRLHPGRHPRWSVRARPIRAPISVVGDDHHHRPGGDGTVRRIRDHPAAVRDRAGTELQAAGDNAAAGVRDRRGGTWLWGAVDRRGADPDGQFPASGNRARPGAGHVLDRAGDPAGGHHQPGGQGGVCHAAVRGSGAGAAALPVRKSWRRGRVQGPC